MWNHPYFDSQTVNYVAESLIYFAVLWIVMMSSISNALRAAKTLFDRNYLFAAVPQLSDIGKKQYLYKYSDMEIRQTMLQSF